METCSLDSCKSKPNRNQASTRYASATERSALGNIPTLLNLRRLQSRGANTLTQEAATALVPRRDYSIQGIGAHAPQPQFVRPLPATMPIRRLSCNAV